jgi:toxin ParE1/3/4
MAVSRRTRFLADMWEVVEYLGADDPDVALRFVDRVEATVAGLERMPGIGDAAPFADPRYAGIRRTTVRNFRKYVVYYRERADGIELLRLLHGSRDIRTIFGTDE